MLDFEPGFSVSRAGPLVFETIAATAEPPPDMTVSEWAEAKRYLGSESGSRFAGKWTNARVPLMIEVQDVCGVDHPCREVAISGGAQIAKSEAGLNALLHMIRTASRSALVILPSQEEFGKWNRVKFNTTIEVTEDLHPFVVDTKSRSEDSSTTAYKKLRGDGFVQLTTASSSKGLQGLPVGYIIAEEVTEYEDDVGGRGDPVTQAQARMDGWGDEGKIIYISTPGTKGECRITELFEKGDQRIPYVPCPECSDYITVDFANMGIDEDGEYFVCPSCGSHLYESAKADMIANGVWAPTFRSPDPNAPRSDDPDEEGPENPDNPRPPAIIPACDLGRWLSPESHMRLYGKKGGRDTEGRYPSFRKWQALSGLGSWARIWKRWIDAQSNPTKMRTFTQQTLGLPYEEKGEAPNHEVLAEHWQNAKRPAGVIPGWACMLTGMADVQGDRIEWGAYAWGPGGRGQRIAGGVIPGQPEASTTWAELGRVVRLTFPGETCVDLGFDRFLVDAGFKSPWVYKFASGYPVVMATKGDRDPMAPELGTPTKVQAKIPGVGVVASTELYPLGQYGLKKRVYFGLKRGLQELETGEFQDGALGFDGAVDVRFFKQITAEFLNPKKKYKGKPLWDKPDHQANEQLDIAVGALAGAVNFGLDRLDYQGWVDLFKARAKSGADTDLAPLERMWTRSAADLDAEARANAEARARKLIDAEKQIIQPAPKNPSPKPKKPAWMQRLSEINKGS